MGCAAREARAAGLHSSPQSRPDGCAHRARRTPLLLFGFEEFASHEQVKKDLATPLLFEYFRVFVMPQAAFFCLAVFST